MNARHKQFVTEYFKCNMNATDAYSSVYPKASYDSARANGAKLLANENIKKTIELKLEQASLQANDLIIKQAILDLPLKRKNRPNKVYFIQAENGLVKIGITSNVTARIKVLNTASPIDLKILFWIEIEKARTLEKSLHNIFNKKRIKGEWYALTAQDIEWVKGNHETYQ